ncbi:hypothetical protein IWQ62_000276 [Dispira parvispora]|uniref:Uncharacterized protein n=1 Tax=Dispira parvispora TaxID=1520584 RepID=A0A9W8AYQ2_9FUNG|nr:hypothetical protein IWQ62_000276 [Dispira parvispora]
MKKHEKEKVQALQDLQADLDVSIYNARTLVASWLLDTDKPDDDQKTFLKHEQDLGVLGNERLAKAKDEFQGRPVRLGLGAKFITHKDALQRQFGNAGGQATPGRSQANAITDFKLKRKLVGKHSASGSFHRGTTSKPTNKPDPASDSESEGESKSRYFRKPASHSLPVASPSQSNKPPAVTGKRKSVMAQGDFLSQFLVEKKSKVKKPGH